MPVAYEPGEGKGSSLGVSEFGEPGVGRHHQGRPGRRGDRDIGGRRFSAGSSACNDGQVGTRRITQGRAASRSPTGVERPGMLRQPRPRSSRDAGRWILMAVDFDG